MEPVVNRLVESKWLLVVAGNYQEFLDYCQRHGLAIRGQGRKARYISSPMREMGSRNIPYTVIGSGWKREDYPQIVEQMKVCGNFEVFGAEN